jgi:hypothetical protein
VIVHGRCALRVLGHHWPGVGGPPYLQDLRQQRLHRGARLHGVHGHLQQGALLQQVPHHAGREAELGSGVLLLQLPRRVDDGA